ncbi:zinc ribbon domain-containing protein [Peptostreptococcaceae bacterium AGR-M142]
MSKFFKSIKKNIHKKVANVSTKSYTAIEASKIKGYISNLEEQRDVLVCELGKKIYQLSKKNELDLETIEENCDFIKEFDKKIDLQFEKLRLIKLEEQEILNSYNKKPQEFFNEFNNENKNIEENINNIKTDENLQNESDLNENITNDLNLNKDINYESEEQNNIDITNENPNDIECELNKENNTKDNISKNEIEINNLDKNNIKENENLSATDLDKDNSNKIKCIACSKLNDSNSNFCFNCGTKLEEDFD